MSSVSSQGPAFTVYSIYDSPSNLARLADAALKQAQREAESDSDSFDGEGSFLDKMDREAPRSQPPGRSRSRSRDREGTVESTYRSESQSSSTSTHAGSDRSDRNPGPSNWNPGDKENGPENYEGDPNELSLQERNKLRELREAYV
jgi:hypothetical protein